jgi:hypothetical protein
MKLQFHILERVGLIISSAMYAELRFARIVQPYFGTTLMMSLAGDTNYAELAAILIQKLKA